MTDLARKMESLREHVKPRWTEQRQATVQARLSGAAARRSQVKLTLAFAALVAAVAAVVVGWPSGEPLRGPEPPARAADAPLLELRDGSKVAALSKNAQVVPVAGEGTTLRLAEGAARFEVAPQQGAGFRVLARDVTISVVGTVFSVALEPDGVRVAVAQGRVQVSWPDGERVLSAGGKLVVSAKPQPEPAPITALRPQPEPPRAPPKKSWRTLAQRGEYGAAYRELTAQGGAGVKDTPRDLLLAADVARLGGHPEQAVGYLRKVVSGHAGDSRAPLAAFTLGRVLLDQLGRPHEAAGAFARARNLAPGGALAEDALAREVESWSMAGQPARARERGEEYLQRYPKGRRRKAVESYAGIE